MKFNNLLLTSLFLGTTLYISENETGVMALDSIDREIQEISKRNLNLPRKKRRNVRRRNEPEFMRIRTRRDDSSSCSDSDGACGKNIVDEECVESGSDKCVYTLAAEQCNWDGGDDDEYEFTFNFYKDVSGIVDDTTGDVPCATYTARSGSNNAPFTMCDLPGQTCVSASDCLNDDYKKRTYNLHVSCSRAWNVNKGYVDDDGDDEGPHPEDGYYVQSYEIIKYDNYDNGACEGKVCNCRCPNCVDTTDSVCSTTYTNSLAENQCFDAIAAGSNDYTTFYLSFEDNCNIRGEYTGSSSFVSIIPIQGEGSATIGDLTYSTSQDCTNWDGGIDLDISCGNSYETGEITGYNSFFDTSAGGSGWSINSQNYNSGTDTCIVNTCPCDSCDSCPNKRTTCNNGECGLISDNCGGDFLCETDCCDALTCDDVQGQCGNHDDGCGGTIYCGCCCIPVTAGENCTANDCNLKPDGCGGYIDCGACTDCVVTTTCQSDDCNWIQDNCGGFINCGPCDVVTDCTATETSTIAPVNTDCVTTIFETVAPLAPTVFDTTTTFTVVPTVTISDCQIVDQTVTVEVTDVSIFPTTTITPTTFTVVGDLTTVETLTQVTATEVVTHTDGADIVTVSSCSFITDLTTIETLTQVTATEVVTITPTTITSTTLPTVNVGTVTIVESLTQVTATDVVTITPVTSTILPTVDVGTVTIIPSLTQVTATDVVTISPTTITSTVVPTITESDCTVVSDVTTVETLTQVTATEVVTHTDGADIITVSSCSFITDVASIVSTEVVTTTPITMTVVPTVTESDCTVVSDITTVESLTQVTATDVVTISPTTITSTVVPITTVRDCTLVSDVTTVETLTQVTATEVVTHTDGADIITVSSCSFITDVASIVSTEVVTATPVTIEPTTTLYTGVTTFTSVPTVSVSDCTLVSDVTTIESLTQVTATEVVTHTDGADIVTVSSCSFITNVASIVSTAVITATPVTIEPTTTVYTGTYSVTDISTLTQVTATDVVTITESDCTQLPDVTILPTDLVCIPADTSTCIPIPTTTETTTTTESETCTTDREPPTTTTTTTTTPTNCIPECETVNVLTKRDFIGINSDVQGLLLAGRDITISGGYSLGDQINPDGNDCDIEVAIAGRDISTSNIDDVYGDIVFRRNNNAMNNAVRCQIVQRDDRATIDALFEAYKDISDYLKNLTPNVIAVPDGSGTTHIDLSGIPSDETVVVLIEDTDEDVYQLDNYNGHNIVFNVLTNEPIIFKGLVMPQHQYNHVWNFPNTNVLTLRNNWFYGIYMAPRADVNGFDGTLWGQLIAKNYEGTNLQFNDVECPEKCI